MSFPQVLNISKSKVNEAGRLLVTEPPDTQLFRSSLSIVNSWRIAHAYPLNTFNSTLRDKVRRFRNPIVAQRLKRLPTIIDKLQRYPNMQLARMQDIGGVRGIVNSIKEVKILQSEYEDSRRFSHKLARVDDYILNPKVDGYRGVHLVYKYHNTLARNGLASNYEGLSIELQLRTKLQHTWATAVETMGMFRGEALKSRQGSADWLDFFSITSSAFSYIEKTPQITKYANLSLKETILKMVELENKLHVIEQIQGLSIAAKAIHTRGIGGFYNLIILNIKQRSVEVKSYRKDQLITASNDYAAAENEAAKGANIEPVLVSVGSLKSLKQAYPNYFLDISDFVKKVELLIETVKP